MPDRRGFPMGHQHLEQTKAWYDSFYATGQAQSSLRQPWNQQKHRTVTWYPALLLATGTILEVGCGAGHFAAMCRDFGLDYVAGTDYSDYALTLARRVARGVNFRKLDAREHGFKELLIEHEPDTVVALEVLEHIWDDLAVIEALPAGTTFVGSVPDFFTEGHVRWFATEGQVRNRYGKLLDIKRVITERGVKSSNQWFIFKGVRK